MKTFYKGKEVVVLTVHENFTLVKFPSHEDHKAFWAKNENLTTDTKG